MKPLSQFEIHELMEKMDTSIVGAPIGSMWTTPDVQNIFVVLFHANMWNQQEAGIVMQNIPGGECWVISVRDFYEGPWTNIGFVWDREEVE